MWHVLREASRQGVTEFDFLGADASWHADWTGHIRPHAWLYIFRPGPKASLIHAAKFRLLPGLRRHRRAKAALGALSSWMQ